MKAMIAATLGAIAVVSTGHAQVFGTGQLYGGSMQRTATCYLFNAGNKAVTLGTLSLYLTDAGMASGHSNCPATLNGGAGCNVTGSVASASTGVSCAIQPVQTATLRGSLEVRDSSGNILVAQPMR